VNQYPQQYYGYYPAQYQAQWVEFIMPVMMGLIMLVFVGGMIRDLFMGKEVKLP
jgi:hypothetical protein